MILRGKMAPNPIFCHSRPIFPLFGPFSHPAAKFLQKEISRRSLAKKWPKKWHASENQKNPFSVRKIFARNSGAGNGCANFMDAWKNAFFLQERPMSIKFLVLGGGVFWVFGGGSADFIFMGARIFLRKSDQKVTEKLERWPHIPFFLLGQLLPLFGPLTPHNPLVYSGFWPPTPLIKGVKCHPLNEKGYGWSGSCLPRFPGERKSQNLHFSAFFGSISGQRPELISL